MWSERVANRLCSPFAEGSTPVARKLQDANSQCRPIPLHGEPNRRRGIDVGLRSSHLQSPMPFDFHDLTSSLEKRSSRRLALRSLAFCDAWPLFQASRVPRFNEYLTWETPQQERDAEARVDAILRASRLGQMTALSAVARETGEWISLFRFQPSGRGPRSLEIGVWTHPKFWHGRYSPELMTLCIDAAFECSDIDEIVGAGAVENRGSLSLMRVAGMKAARSFSKETESGVMLPAIEYQLSRSDWIELGKKRGDRRHRAAEQAECEPA